MALVASSLPNLVSGVSQQPPTLRLSSACEEQVNYWPSVVAGLQKRPPTEHIATLGIDVGGNAVGYLIDKDNEYRYIVVVSEGSLYVYDFDGNAQTVSFPDGKAYLTQSLNPVQDFRFITLGDTTFVLNRAVRTQAVGPSEKGSFTITPTGTVASMADLPGTPTLGNIYFVTSLGKYVRYETVAPKPAKNGWVATTGWLTEAPPGTQVNSLPTTVTLGQTIVLISAGTSYNPDNSGLGPGIFYRQYVGQEVEPAVPSSNQWIQRTAYELTTISNDRMNPYTMATVHVTESFANIYYSIYINGVLKAEYLTSAGTDATNSVQGTDVIANNLAADLIAAGYTVYRYGSTLSIRDLPVGTEVQTTSGLQGDNSLKSYTDTVQNFSDLPPNEAPGRIVKVLGDPDEQGDDYYVIYRDGFWEETYGYGETNEIQPSTMPHVLVRNADGSWTFKQHFWRNREAGDSESNPDPSFIGNKISDIFVYTNRMGFLSDENIILSEADNFENFYRTTLAQLLDSDPLDFAVLSSDVLRHAIPFNKDLLLMSDRSQYRFKYNNFLGPKTVEAQFTTSFFVAPSVRPLNMGTSVYFLDDRPEYQYSKLYEYYPRDDGVSDDAEDATGAVPQYLARSITVLAGSPRTKTIVAYSPLDPATLYVYKFYWAGDKKVQNAWGKWVFEDCQQIYWAGFSGNYLYLLMKRSDGVHLERIRIDEEAKVNDFAQRIFVDRMVMNDPSGSASPLVMFYDPDADETVIELPWDSTAPIEIISSEPDSVTDPIKNFRHVVNKVGPGVVRVAGEISTHEVVAGIQYTSEYTFSKQYVRQAKNSGEVVLLDGRLQMRYMTIEYHDTAYFKVRLEVPGREPYEWSFDGKTVGDPQAVLGNTVPLEGTVNVPLMARNIDVTLKLINDSPFSCAFGSAEWKAIYSPKAKQRL